MFDINAEKQEGLMHVVQGLVDKATSRGDRPFAALLIDEQGNVIASATNTSVTTKNVAAHAEINLLGEAAKKLQTRDLSSYSIVVNAAPCPMCMTGLIKAKIRHLYYGAPMEKDANPFITPEEIASKSKLRVEITSGILAEDCQAQIARGRSRL